MAAGGIPFPGHPPTLTKTYRNGGSRDSRSPTFRDISLKPVSLFDHNTCRSPNVFFPPFFNICNQATNYTLNTKPGGEARRKYGVPLNRETEKLHTSSPGELNSCTAPLSKELSPGRALPKDLSNGSEAQGSGETVDQHELSFVCFPFSYQCRQAPTAERAAAY